jgi:hypothetical protein
MTLSIKSGDQDSAARSLAALKSELAREKAAQEKAQVKTEILTWSVGNLKKMTNGFTTQIPILEEKVKHLDNKVLDELAKIHAKELGLDRTIKANEDYRNQNTWLTKKLESKLLSPLPPRSCILFNILLTPLRLTETDAELNALKAMVENVVVFFYPNGSSSASLAPNF